jgi:thiol-disulfide isomerase/thioredoxin
MKQIFIFLALVFAVGTARADFVIKQKVESPMMSGEVTMQIKGDKVRTDVPFGLMGMGSMSTIADLNTGDTVMLMHKHKAAAKISGAQLKEQMAAVKKQVEKAAVAGAAKPQAQDTGKTEKVGDYNPEIYTWASTNGMKMTLWVAKDFPNYKQIQEQLKKLSELSPFGMGKSMGPDENTLPGMVVKREMESLGQKITTTLISAKEEPVDLAVFEVPKDYTDMTQPETTPEMKQKEGEMAADTKRWLQQQPVTPEMKQRQMEAQKIQAALAIGVKFPDFNEKDTAGKPLAIANYKGKVVLIDFWATWCGPCRAELPNVIATYKKYHNQGFEIIGISLDQDQAKLTGFTKSMNMTWPQYFDGQGWGNKLAVKYGMESIPATYLLDGNGKIIGRDLRGDELTQAVAKALGK